MIDQKMIEKLAHLSRLSLTSKEKETLPLEFERILSYVEEINKVSESAPEHSLFLKNVMRNDEDPHPKGVYSEDLLKEAPSTKEGYIQVRKIIDQG